ncbi:MAG: hypothetical protein AAFP84_00335 [Actinomycetota bacterium]
MDDDVVTVTVNDTTTETTPGIRFDTPESSGPACSPWSPTQSFESAQDDDPLLPGLNRTEPDGTISTWSTRSCDGQAPDFAWIPTSVDPVVVIDNAIAQAIERIPRPTPEINPAPDVGSYVNLGLWLATTDPGPIDVTASVGGVSATATITLVSTTFDLGDGTTITCDGNGTPIPDDAVESADQSPTCGHTYRQSSPNDDPYRLAITATSEVTWSASTGATGNAGTYATSTVVDYDVDELQTLGTG